jgi:hypothetical protein
MKISRVALIVWRLLIVSVLHSIRSSFVVKD